MLIEDKISDIQDRMSGNEVESGQFQRMEMRSDCLPDEFKAEQDPVDQTAHTVNWKPNAHGLEASRFILSALVAIQLSSNYKLCQPTMTADINSIQNLQIILFCVAYLPKSSLIPTFQTKLY